MDINHQIIDRIGVLHETGTGWTFEVNTVSWNGAEPKIDLRNWLHSEGKVGKGITLTEDEARQLVKLLSAYLEGKEGA